MFRRVNLVILLGLIIVIVLSFGLSAGAAQEEPGTTEGEQIQSVQDELAERRAATAGAHEAYNNAVVELGELNSDIAKTQNELADAEARLTEAQNNLTGQASQIYRSGSVAFLDVLVGVQDFNDFANRLNLWILLLDNQQNEVAELRAARDDLQAQLEERRAQLEEREKATAEAESWRDRANALEAETQNYLDSLNTDLLEAIEAEREAAAAQALEEARKNMLATQPEPVVAQPEPVVAQPEPVATGPDPAVLQALEEQLQTLEQQRAEERKAAEYAAEQAAAADKARKTAEEAAAAKEAEEEAAAAKKAEEEEAAAAKKAEEQAAAADKARKAEEEAAAAKKAEEEEAAAAKKAEEEEAAAAKKAEEQAAAADKARKTAEEAAAAKAANDRKAEEEAAAAKEAEEQARLAAEKAAKAANDRKAEEEAAEAERQKTQAAMPQPNSPTLRAAGAQPKATPEAEGQPKATPEAEGQPKSGSVPSSGGGGAPLGEARSVLGTPYVWGGESPDVGFDCSGLVKWSYRGIMSLPHSVDGIGSMGTRISPSEAGAGDVLVWPGYHVAMATEDPGMMIHASNYYMQVIENSRGTMESPAYAVRLI